MQPPDELEVEERALLELDHEELDVEVPEVLALLVAAEVEPPGDEAPVDELLVEEVPGDALVPPTVPVDERALLARGA